MLKLRTKITLLVCSVIAAILILNQYPVSMSLKQTVLETNGSALLDVARQCARSLSHALERGEYAMLPSDLLETIPEILKENSDHGT